MDDCGGGYSDSIADICDELSTGASPVLMPTPNARTEAGSNQDCLVLNARLARHQTRGGTDWRTQFEFLGVLFGFAARSGAPVSIPLSPPIWKLLVGQPIALGDLNEIDSNFLSTLTAIREMDAATLADSELPFSSPDSFGLNKRLSPTETNITVNNRDLYLRLATEFRLHEFNTVAQWVREGMARTLPLPLLSLFTPSELETMACYDSTCRL